MKISELRDSALGAAQVIPEVEEEVLEDTQVYQDLCESVDLLESCLKLLMFLSDKRFNSKIEDVDRTRVLHICRDVKEFIDLANTDWKF